MDIQNFIAEFKKTFVYDMLCESLEDEQLFEHTIVDNQVIWMKEQTRQMWSMWQAAKASVVGKGHFVVLNCHQIKQALDFGAPDLSSEIISADDHLFQLETEMTIEWLADGHSGSGYYCWYTDLPEEGSIYLSAELEAQEPTND